MLNSYLDLIETRLSSYYDITTHIHLHGQLIDLFAALEVHNERYFVSQRAKLWLADTYEYVFMKSFNDLDQHTFQEFLTYLQNAIAHFAKPHSDHMETLITGVLVVDQEPDTHLQARASSFRYRKNFKLTLEGWAEIRLILVVPSSNTVIANRRGKEVKHFYAPVFKQRQSDSGLAKLKRIVPFRKV